MNELFLNPGHFIQLARLRAGNSDLRDLLSSEPRADLS